MFKEQKDYSSDILPLNYESIKSGIFFFDMVYNPKETAMMQAFKQHGANVKNGLEMLHGQADAAWDIVQESLLDNMDNTM
jgi:shikimate dehydrogenase